MGCAGSPREMDWRDCFRFSMCLMLCLCGMRDAAACVSASPRAMTAGRLQILRDSAAAPSAANSRSPASHALLSPLLGSVTCPDPAASHAGPTSPCVRVMVSMLGQACAAFRAR